MTLDPQSEWVLGLVEKAGHPPIETLDVARARALYDDTAWRLDFEPAPMASVAELAVLVERGSIRVRVYTPEGVPVAGAPALVYFHGGGFVIGSLDSHDRLCRALAERAGCKVVAVDYRLAPEHPFPTPLEDALAAFRWVAEKAGELGIDAARIAVGGDSAGGNLAAVLSQRARDEGGPGPCFQLLIYPATDARGGHPSRAKNAEGYLLTEATIDWFRGHYLPDGTDLEDPRVSPLLADDLSGLPPALVATAGYDPLRDEGADYAKALAAAGVAVEHRDHPGMMHGFFNMGGALTVAEAAVDEAAAALRAAFGDG